MENQTEYSPGSLRMKADEGATIVREIEKSIERLLILAEDLMKEHHVQESERLLQDLKYSAGNALSGYRMQIRHLYMAAELYEKGAGDILSEVEQIVTRGGLRIRC